MAGTVDDLLETLHGPISSGLRAREGRRLSKHMSQKFDALDVHESGNPSIPSGTKKGDPGSAGHELTPDKAATAYEQQAIEDAHRTAAGGSAVPELDEEK